MLNKNLNFFVIYDIILHLEMASYVSDYLVRPVSSGSAAA